MKLKHAIAIITVILIGNPLILLGMELIQVIPLEISNQTEKIVDYYIFRPDKAIEAHELYPYQDSGKMLISNISSIKFYTEKGNFGIANMSIDNQLILRLPKDDKAKKVLHKGKEEWTVDLATLKNLLLGSKMTALLIINPDGTPLLVEK